MPMPHPPDELLRNDSLRSHRGAARSHSVERAHRHARSSILAPTICLTPTDRPRPHGLPRTGESVAFIAAPYGFGPSSKAIAICSYLPRSIKRVFFGDGPPLELAKSSREFSMCQRLDFNMPADEVAEIMGRYRTLVFVNSTRFLAACSLTCASVLFVDTLAWVRKSLPFSLPTLSGYFAQRFFDHPFAADLDSASYFHATGAIVPKTLAESQNEDIVSRKAPIVHCGGLFSPAMRPGADTAFVKHLCRALRKTDLSVRVILPKHLHSEFTAQSTPRMSLIDCSPVDVRRHIEGSLFALTTSGIEFTYESTLLGVPTFFLPPFNATQLLQLDYHRRAFDACIPFRLNNETPRPTAQSLDTVTETVQEQGMSGTWVEQFDALSRHLKRTSSGQFIDNLTALQSQQRRSFETVGIDGADTIASHILSNMSADRSFQWICPDT